MTDLKEEKKEDQLICRLCGYVCEPGMEFHFYNIPEDGFYCCKCVAFRYSQMVIDLQTRLFELRKKTAN